MVCGVGEHGGLPLQARTGRAPPSHWATFQLSWTHPDQPGGWSRWGDVLSSASRCPSQTSQRVAWGGGGGWGWGGQGQAWSPRVAQAYLSVRRSLSLLAGPVACGVESQERRPAQKKAVREQLAATVLEAAAAGHKSRAGSPPHPPPFMRHPHPSPVLRGVSHLSGGPTGNSDLLKIFSPSSFIDAWELPAGKGQG